MVLSDNWFYFSSPIEILQLNAIPIKLVLLIYSLQSCDPIFDLGFSFTRRLIRYMRKKTCQFNGHLQRN